MALSDLTGKLISESGVIALNKQIAKLDVFAKSFSPAGNVPFGQVAVPVYALTPASQFNATTNNYATTNEIGGEVIPLSNHFVRTVTCTDMTIGEAVGDYWYKDTATALADAIGTAVNKTVFEGIDSTLTATAPTTKQLVAGLYKVAADNNINVGNAVIVLNPETYANVLAMLDSNIYGSQSAIVDGVIKGLYGFKAVICSPYLVDGAKGLVLQDSAVGFVNRANVDNLNAYPEFWTSTSDSGFTVTFRKFTELATGKVCFAADAIFGSKTLLSDKIIKLV